MRAKANSAMRQDRYQELKGMLEERRLEIIEELQHKMRDVRNEHAAASLQNVRDEAETSEAEIQDDIEFALLQMKAETLDKVGTALNHLDEGRYGYCYECGEEIPERRLRALPFAVRCTSCEEVREIARQRERMLAGRRTVPSLFADVAG